MRKLESATGVFGKSFEQRLIRSLGQGHRVDRHVRRLQRGHDFAQNGIARTRALGGASGDINHAIG